MTENENAVDLSGIESSLTTIEMLLDDISDATNHPALTTNFEDYTVTEGLLLLLLVCVVAKWSVDMLRRGFSWLL